MTTEASHSEPYGDRAVFVCSRDASWAQTTARVLTMAMGPEAHPVTGVRADLIAEYMHSVGRRPDLYSEDVCLIHLVGPPARTAPEDITLVRKLRTAGGHWPGGLVLIVKNEEARASLSQSDLFGGESDGTNTLGHRNGAHRILIEPVSLPSVLSEICSVGQVWRIEWHRWIRQSPLGPIVRLLRAVQTHTVAEAVNDVSGRYLAELHSRWRGLRGRWSSLCTHGVTLRRAEAICNSRLGDPGEAPRIIHEMREVLRDMGGLGEL